LECKSCSNKKKTFLAGIGSLFVAGENDNTQPHNIFLFLGAPKAAEN